MDPSDFSKNFFSCIGCNGKVFPLRSLKKVVEEKVEMFCCPVCEKTIIIFKDGALSIGEALGAILNE